MGAITIIAFATDTRAADRNPAEVIPWLIAFIGMVLVGGVFIFAVRRWMKSETDSSAGGFTLQDLREMHARGDLSDAEFHSARAAMIGRLAGSSPSSAVNDQQDPDQ